jgi:hypothetical protein
VIITVTANSTPGSSGPAAPFSLAEGGSAGPARLRVREQRNLQVAEFFRSNTVGVFDRLNRRVTLTFEVSRIFNTVDAAQTFLLRHSQLMPTSGLVTVVAEGDGGGYPLFYLPSADISVVEGGHTGVNTRHQYQITAPNIQTTAPLS